MNLGNVRSDSAPRRAWIRQVTALRQLSAMTLAVVVGVFGLVGVHPAEGRAGAQKHKTQADAGEDEEGGQRVAPDIR